MNTLIQCTNKYLQWIFMNTLYVQILRSHTGGITAKGCKREKKVRNAGIKTYTQLTRFNNSK